MGTRGFAAVLLAALCAVAAGCAAPAPPPRPTPAAAADAGDQLREAVRRTTASTFAVTVEGASFSSLLVSDPGGDRRRRIMLTLTDEGSVSRLEVRVIGRDTWINQSGTADSVAAAWYHADTAKLSFTPLAVAPDGGLTEMAESAYKVAANGSTLTGTALMSGSRSTIRAKLMGPERMALPFTAVVDGDGRLAKLAIDGRLVGTEASATSTFSDFGKPVVVEPPPAAAVVELTEEQLEALTGG